MLRRFGLLIPLLFLAACVSKPVAPVANQPLERNFLACRNQQSLDALHKAGAHFQRQADDELASGRCRMFQKGHEVGSRTGGGFVDPASNTQFWIYHWG